jgi:hypothetical protein
MAEPIADIAGVDLPALGLAKGLRETKPGHTPRFRPQIFILIRILFSR